MNSGLPCKELTHEILPLMREGVEKNTKGKDRENSTHISRPQTPATGSRVLEQEGLQGGGRVINLKRAECLRLRFL